MWNEVLSTAVSNGVFATLFVALLIYELKDSRKRETKYQSTIENLSEKLNTVDEIKQGVVEIKEQITKLSKPKRSENETDKNI